MSFFSYALGAVILILVLLRQVRVRPVPRVFQPRLPVVIGVIGLFEMFSYADNHHVSSSAWLWVLGTLAVGALGLGVLRGLSMRVWPGNGWVLRQGNAITMALWLVSLLVHFAGDTEQAHAGASGLEGASFLLYLGVTLCVQYYVVHRRALPLWAQLGPDAGRPLAVQFMQSPGAFFATFTGPGGWGQGPGQGQGQGQAAAGRASYADDPSIIDAEVVDDDDHGPPELHAPH
ncbi:MAG TPA: hypothetical protein VHX67_05725 [Acidimicrobiales bacterium]|nr:hypothetical protein [Acidimicrobiales bacterium]